jgi:hypothetical protein
VDEAKFQGYPHHFYAIIHAMHIVLCARTAASDFHTQRPLYVECSLSPRYLAGDFAGALCTLFYGKYSVPSRFACSGADSLRP